MELTIGQLAATAAAAVVVADVHGATRRVTDLPDERTIRWYATIGLLDRPTGNRGRTALYGERHLLQLVAIKRRQAQGRTLAEIQAELVGATDRTLRRIADVAQPREVAAAPKASSPSTGRGFWRERPASTQSRDVLVGLAVGDGVVLMLPAQPNKSEVEMIQAAAQPLLELLAERRLSRGCPP